MPVTYSAATHTITVTGFTLGTPCTFADIYNADKAGTLSLHARTGVSAVDGAPVAVDRAERPADYVILGGASNDLYITVANWTNMTTTTIRITGTDRDGAAQTEDLIITGNGTTSTTKWFKTITHTQITVFTKTDAGSYDYDLIQGQWGVAWNQGTNQYLIESNVHVDTNSYLIDSAVHYQLGTAGGTVNMTSTAGSLFQLTDSAWIYYGIGVAAKYWYGEVKFYHCLIYKPTGDYRNFWFKAASTFENCYIASRGIFWHIGVLTVRESVFWGLGGHQWYFYSATLPDIDDMRVENWNRAVFSWAGAPTIKNVVFANLTISIWVRGANEHVIAINCTYNTAWLVVETDSWWKDRREFDLKVVDSDGTGIPNVNVVMVDKDGNSGDNQGFSTTTDASGDIATQEVQYYKNDAGVETTYSPHTLTISKPGYATRTIIYTMDRKREEIEKLGGAAPHGREYRRRRVPAEVSALDEYE